MENLNGVGKVVAAVVVGSLVGIGLGILFAPEKGSKTRRNLINGAKDMTDDFKQKMKDEAKLLRKKATDLEDLAKEKMDDLSKNMKRKAEKAGEEAKA